VEECGPCHFFASFTLAFALQLRKKHGKTSVRVRKTSVRFRKTSVRIQYTYYQNTHTLLNPHKHTHSFNPLKAKLNSICLLLEFLGAHPIFHVSRIRVKSVQEICPYRIENHTAL
jgi:hypothetical protein